MIKSFALLSALIASIVGVPSTASAAAVQVDNPTAIVTQFDTGEIVYYMQFPIEQYEGLSRIEALINGGGYSFGENKNATIRNEDDKEVTYHYYAAWMPKYSADSVEVWLSFGNYYSFAKFNGIKPDESPRPKTITKTSLFFREYTQNLQNPFTKFFSSSKCSEIMALLNNELTGGRGVNCGFIFSSGVRRTTVENYDKLVRASDGSYNYYFTVSPSNTEDIIVFDRTANTPVWYAVGVIATAAAMALFYVILRNRQKSLKTDAA